jgi:hypothetical protein
MAADDRRERFAQMTESVIGSSLDDGCFRLLAWLDKEIGGKPWTRTVAQAGAGLSWQHRTVTKHAEHLAQIGFVKIGRRSDVASADLRLLVRPGTSGLALPKPVPIKHRRPANHRRTRPLEIRRGGDGTYLSARPYSQTLGPYPRAPAKRAGARVARRAGASVAQRARAHRVKGTDDDPLRYLPPASCHPHGGAGGASRGGPCSASPGPGLSRCHADTRSPVPDLPDVHPPGRPLPRRS